MTTFTKWFLLNAVMLTAVFFAETKGAISLMVKNDISHLTIVIMALYVVVSVVVGRLCFLSDKINKGREKEARRHLSKRAEVGWFAAEHFFTLGLLGTVFGLCVATATSLNEGTEISDIVSGLKTGLNTAFYTTICGIIFSLPLQAQLMILRFKLEE
jgi:Ca2+/Na+ antiporter